MSTFTCRVYYDCPATPAQLVLEVISSVSNEHAEQLAKEATEKMGWEWEDCTSPDSDAWHQGDE